MRVLPALAPPKRRPLVDVLATPACPRSGGRPDLYSVGPGRHQQTGPAPRRWRAGGGGPSGARPQTRRADTPERWPLMEAFATPTHPTGGGSPDLHSVGPGPHQQTGPAPRRWRVWGMDPPAPSLDLFPKVPPYSGSVLATKESFFSFNWLVSYRRNEKRKEIV